MTKDEAAAVWGRLNAIWPPKQQPALAEVQEWMLYFLPLDLRTAEAAIDSLRLTLNWRPTMAEFRDVYRQVAAAGLDDERALPSGSGTAERNRRLYGENVRDWVYCARCDQAITLEELATTPHYVPGRGLVHMTCPRPGTAPVMPAHLRLEREEARRRHGSFAKSTGKQA